MRRYVIRKSAAVAPDWTNQMMRSLN